MTAHVALLRAINVGGRNTIAMADLRDLFATLGFPGARTLLQSGNVVFEGDGSPEAELERRLEAATAKHLGVKTDYLVRSAASWRRVVRANPYPDEARRDPGHLLVMFLKKAPPSGAVAELQAALRGRETVRAVGAHAYLVYPDGIGRSRLTAALLEGKLGARGTARNWNTVTRLAALLT